jgi:hypothetical protein
MYIIDSPFHIIFSNENDAPALACVGKCKKSWWKSDLEENAPDKCPLCAGGLCAAVNGVHFTVLSNANRELKLSDFKKITSMGRKDKHDIKKWINQGIRIANLGMVKPAFEDKAKNEWSV